MKLFKFKKVNKLMKKIERIVGKKNMEKAKETINTEAHKASDKIGDAVAKRIKGVDGDKIENELNKYIDKYIK